MTIKWVKSDPLVMNGEPFCYGTRLTVRNLLEMRAGGRARPPGCSRSTRSCGAWASRRRSCSRRRTTGIATPTFFAPDGSLTGPGFTAEEAAGSAGPSAHRRGHRDDRRRAHPGGRPPLTPPGSALSPRSATHGPRRLEGKAQPSTS